jgi:hypothetical protein
MGQQNIQLNFWEITPQYFFFFVFRKQYIKYELNEYIYKYRLTEKEGGKSNLKKSASYISQLWLIKVYHIYSQKI